METIKKIFKIGTGPSSSHTMGPAFAAERFKVKNAGAKKYRVTLYGSLAATGKGHLTDVTIIKVIDPVPVEIVWEQTALPFHPNGMMFEALDKNNSVFDKWVVYSIGGGELAEEGKTTEFNRIYTLDSMDKIKEWCVHHGKTFWEYVEEQEKEDIRDYLEVVWKTMSATVKKGIKQEGVLAGAIHLPRKAASYFVKANGYKGALRRKSLVYAYALAVSEENASGGQIVTAPTCGSCGVLPAVLFLLHNYNHFDELKIIRALATAGLIGNLVKKNASISGAEVGCQGEVGAACAMAAAAATQLFGGTVSQIEYAAEMGLEHHLGLTCDPVHGLVQIPCIERNAFAAARALDCCTFSLLSDGNHRISFDKVVHTMNQTGHDLPSLYRETSKGGLATVK